MKTKLLACRELLQGQRVVCAISGGVDSVALLHGLWSLQELWNMTLTAAHFHHGLRESADRDEAFVKALCQKLKIPLVIGRGDAAAYARDNGMSVEEAGRHLRYEFLFAQEGLVAVAHHGDDQVETVLLNLLRGTGLRGLCAMPQQQGRLVRPLLEATRAEIEAYAEEQQLAYCTDETNLEDDALRNRLRHHVVPVLKEENPSLVKAVSRMTALLQEDEAILHRQTEALLEEARKNDGYDCRILRASPLCKRAVRQLLDTLEKPAMIHVEAVCSLMEELHGTKKVQLPGLTVRREYDMLYFGQMCTTAVPAPVFVQADAPGCVLWGNFEVAWEEPVGEVLIRCRQTGDAVQLHGGTKTVKKLLIDKKIPANKRDTLPIVLLSGEVAAVGDVVCINRKIKVKERER